MTKKPNVIYILADDMGYGDIRAFTKNVLLRRRTLTLYAKTG